MYSLKNADAISACFLQMYENDCLTDFSKTTFMFNKFKLLMHSALTRTKVLYTHCLFKS